MAFYSAVANNNDTCKAYLSQVSFMLSLLFLDPVAFDGLLFHRSPVFLHPTYNVRFLQFILVPEINPF
jgi:hypothetical protein